MDESRYRHHQYRGRPRPQQCYTHQPPPTRTSRRMEHTSGSHQSTIGGTRDNPAPSCPRGKTRGGQKEEEEEEEEEEENR